jgi:two-component system C4-dicarboxylate transport sensor histidine kinase DctB
VPSFQPTAGAVPASPPSAAARARRRGLRWLVAIVLVAAAAGAGWWLALWYGLSTLQQAAERRLEVAATRLDAQLARFDFLPALLETSPEVLRLLDAPGDAALTAQVNHYLESLNAMAGADNLYLVGKGGMTLAAADHAQPGTPFGRDLSYRPYVRDALSQGRGNFYGLGVTSAKAGYYLSYALPARGAARGLAAVKMDLTQIEQEWRQLPGQALLLDEYQVAILTTRDDWRWRPLAALEPAARAEVLEARRYGTSTLQPLAWRQGERVGASATAQAYRVRLEGQAWLASTRTVHNGRWKLLLLDAEGAAQATARVWAISAALAMALLLAASALLAARRREIRQRLASRAALQEAHDALERKVAERTAALQAAQDELVHAGKLAVLGQLSAGLVHELNQPLAALQTFSDNADQLIQRQRLDDARDNLARIGRLVTRLKRLSSQLRLFATRPTDIVGAVVLGRLVQEVRQQLAARLEEGGITVALDIEPESLAVAGDEARLEQVLANLLGNAIDALQGTPAPRRIEVHARAAEGRAHVAIRNNGPLIPETVLARMFQPFVTTKPAGKGMGLGLMISAHIVRECGGTLAARNLAPTGVEFAIDLPARREGGAA